MILIADEGQVRERDRLILRDCKSEPPAPSGYHSHCAYAMGEGEEGIYWCWIGTQTRA